MEVILAVRSPFGARVLRMRIFIRVCRHRKALVLTTAPDLGVQTAVGCAIKQVKTQWIAPVLGASASRISDDWQAHDNIWTGGNKRNQRFARRIVAFLKEHSLEICCDPDRMATLALLQPVIAQA